MYGYVSFQSLKQAIRGKDEAELGQMSHVAFLPRFFEAAFNLWQKKTSGGVPLNSATICDLWR
jgi:hypothetical protein